MARRHWPGTAWLGKPRHGSARRGWCGLMVAVVTVLGEPEKQSVRSVLLRIYEEEGALTPQTVLERAADPEHELHPFFEWDDTEAARRFRLSQAGDLIRRCKITVRTGPEETHRVRAFLHVPPKDSYVPTDSALTEDRDVVLEQCLRDIEKVKLKYAGLLSFADVLRQYLEPEAA